MGRLVEMILPRRLGARFRWLVGSSWVSMLGDGFALAAGPLLVASLTRNPSLVALATLLQRLPWLVLALLAGVLADRWNRAVMVATVDLLRAVVLVVLAASILTHSVDIAIVLVVMLILGTAEVFSNTASTSLLPSLVAREDLVLANARLIRASSRFTSWPARPSGPSSSQKGGRPPSSARQCLSPSGH